MKLAAVRGISSSKCRDAGGLRVNVSALIAVAERVCDECCRYLEDKLSQRGVLGPSKIDAGFAKIVHQALGGEVSARAGSSHGEEEQQNDGDALKRLEVRVLVDGFPEPVETLGTGMRGRCSRHAYSRKCEYIRSHLT